MAWPGSPGRVLPVLVPFDPPDLPVCAPGWAWTRLSRDLDRDRDRVRNRGRDRDRDRERDRLALLDLCACTDKAGRRPREGDLEGRPVAVCGLRGCDRDLDRDLDLGLGRGDLELCRGYCGVPRSLPVLPAPVPLPGAPVAGVVDLVPRVSSRGVALGRLSGLGSRFRVRERDLDLRGEARTDGRRDPAPALGGA